MRRQVGVNFEYKMTNRRKVNFKDKNIDTNHF